jgi:hypothetical protein
MNMSSPTAAASKSLFDSDSVAHEEYVSSFSSSSSSPSSSSVFTSSHSRFLLCSFFLSFLCRYELYIEGILRRWFFSSLFERTSSIIFIVCVCIGRYSSNGPAFPRLYHLHDEDFVRLIYFSLVSLIGGALSDAIATLYVHRFLSINTFHYSSFYLNIFDKTSGFYLRSAEAEAEEMEAKQEQKQEAKPVESLDLLFQPIQDPHHTHSPQSPANINNNISSSNLSTTWSNTPKMFGNMSMMAPSTTDNSPSDLSISGGDTSSELSAKPVIFGPIVDCSAMTSEENRRSFSSHVTNNPQPFTRSTQIHLPQQLTPKINQQLMLPMFPSRQLSVDIAPEATPRIVVASSATNANSVASLHSPVLKDLISARGPKSSVRNHVGQAWTKTPRYRSPANSIFSPRAAGSADSGEKPQPLGAPTPRVNVPAPENAEKWDIFVPARNLWMLVIAFSIHAAHDLMTVTMDASRLASPF